MEPMFIWETAGTVNNMNILLRELQAADRL